MKLFALSMMLMVSTASIACMENGSGFVEENDLRIPVNAKRVGGLTEAQFNAVIDKTEAIYLPIATNMGGKLKIARKWSDATVNANASRFGSSWNVNMYGGLARHSTITEDGFALVLCHEIGHLIGGAPTISSIFSKMANEGQADYFAALKCLRKTFLNDDNAAINASMTIPTTLNSSCAKQFSNETEKNICIRTGMAGVSVANLFAALRNLPIGSFDTPDPAVVNSTYNQHPAHQCRLDTYFQGSLCDISFNEDVSMKDETVATCNTSTGHKIGVRPLCWFKPKAQ